MVASTAKGFAKDFGGNLLNSAMTGQLFLNPAGALGGAAASAAMNGA